MTTMVNTDELTMKVGQLQEQLDRVEHKMDYNNKVLAKHVGKKAIVDEETGDENEERGNWSGKLDFLLSCLGYAVGLGNVWRFPYLAYKNGGGAFFIPYCVMLGIVGIPIFFLELSLGQFSSQGPTTCWKFAELFQGIGFAMMIVSTMVAIYYNMIIGWAFYYLFASFTDDLPWSECRSEWAGPFCGKPNKTQDFSGGKNCLTYGFFQNEETGTCRSRGYNGKIEAIFNKTTASQNNIKRTLPSADYFNHEVLGYTEGKGLEDFGEMHWELVLCLLLAWIFVALTLCKGVKSSGKVVYVTATFPYLVLVILLIRGLLLDGYYEGIKYYIEPDTSILSDAQVWKDAANQIFFSLSASWGGLIALASYNRFNNDVFRDALVVSFGNCLTSLFAGFVIFSYLGFLAHEYGEKVSEIADAGPGLAFIVYPMAITEMPLSPLWSILFFVMLVTLGVDSEFVLVETVTTSILDLYPKARKFKTFVVFGICLTFFLLGLPLCCDGGIDLLDLVDSYAGGWNVLVISLCECIAIGWVYGIGRFLNDIECMTGSKVCGFMPWVVWKWWWAACWCVLTPLCVLFVLVFSWVDYTRVDKLPRWADALGWAMTMVVVIAIFATMIYKCCTTKGSFSERMHYLTTPREEWGPALPKHRRLCLKYVPDMVIDPHNKEGALPPPPPPANHVYPEAKYYDNSAMELYENK